MTYELRAPIIYDTPPPTKKAPGIFLKFDDEGWRWRPEQYFKNALLAGLSERDIEGFIAVRNSEYQHWLKYWMKPSLQMKWQPVRIIKWQDKEAPFYKDKWYRRFIEGVFFVFLQPVTHYDKNGKHYQYYLLSPEDSYLVNKYLYEEHYGAANVPKREDTFLPTHMEMSLPRMIPCELCHHMATHEMEGGKEPDLEVKREVTEKDIYG